MRIHSYKTLPKLEHSNLAYRRELLTAAQRSPAVRADIVKACADDPLLWFASVAWLFEPRPKKGESRVVPFIPWEHQVPEIERIVDNIGHEDIAAEKSRGEGMSWIAVLVSLHQFLFSEDMGAVGLISKSERDADNPGDMDSLMEKAYWEMYQIPRWMAGKEGVDWKRDRSKHLLKNMRNGYTISAFSATGDVASGGRKTFIVFDELAKFPRPADEDAMASTQYVTNSRFFISTPKGTEGAYYKLMHQPSNMIKIVLDWKDNPVRNRGLYRFDRGKPVATDPENNPLPPEYDPPTPETLDLFSRLRRRGFKLEGVVRSPWYDRECDRPGATPQNIAQELDRSYGGSMYRIFGDDFFERTKQTVRPEMKTGVLSVNPENLREIHFDTVSGGPLSLWCPLDMEQRPPDSQYAIGVDICSGIGGSHTSNSIITVVDLISKTQVLEYYSNSIPPSKWAEYAVAIAHWFHGAFLAWEHNGPGSAFTKRVLELHYTNIYRRVNLWNKSRNKRTGSTEPGWVTNANTKEVMFEDMNRLVGTGEWVVRSKALAREAGQYVRDNGKITCIKYSDEDDTNSHGDRVIAFGIALQAAKTRPIDKAPTDALRTDRPIPPNTMASRMQQWEEDDRRQADPWDHTSLSELTQSSGALPSSDSPW